MPPESDDARPDGGDATCESDGVASSLDRSIAPGGVGTGDGPGSLDGRDGTEEVASASSVLLTGARVVTPDAVLDRGRVRIVDGRIDAVGSGIEARGHARLDLDSATLVPGLVDLHGDDFERHRQPRSGVEVPLPVAMRTCEAAALAAGVTTKCHAVAFEDAPDDGRSLDEARAVASAMAETDESPIDHRVHARCEVSDPESLATVRDLVASGVADLVSLMHHAPGRGQFADQTAFSRRHVADRGWSEADARRVAERRDERLANSDAVARERRALFDAIRRADLPLASHDDETPADVDGHDAVGVDIAEFPMTEAAARRATERGMDVAMGAPNLVRGGSAWGNLSAEAAVEAGLVDVLCSDYHPMSLLRAAFTDTGEPLHERVARITAEPARAAGFEDRGRIEPGARADLVAVEPAPVPTVRNVLVAGESVYRARQ